MNYDETLKFVLDQHKKWQTDPDTGNRLSLPEANLTGADLGGAKLPENES